MPRFFFHLIDGVSDRDGEGTELSDFYTAQAAAVRVVGELLRDLGGKLLDHAQWRLEVADEQGASLFVVQVRAQELAATTERTRERDAD